MPRRAYIQRNLTAAGAALVAGGLASPAAMAQPKMINPRSTWGADLHPTGPLMNEQPGDVRVLLVHHTAETNDYRPADVTPILRSIYKFHTGRRGWADVAYNFFVDRYGGIWEGRTGSLDGPVIGDATGGNQGYSQLCCFVGNHQVEEPTQAAWSSMVWLLARLADEYALGTTPGSTASFESRGSNKWPAGETVTLPTIAGHRDVSLTECPGDAAYEVVAGDLNVLVGAARTQLPTTTVADGAAVPATSAPTTTTLVPAQTSPDTAAAPTTLAELAAPNPRSNDPTPWGPWALVVAAATGAAAIGLAALRRRTSAE